MSKFKTQFMDDYKGSPGEKNRFPSQTIPNASLSIQEIIKRFASGLPISEHRRVVSYTEDELLPDFGRMDPTEREEYLEELNAKIADMKDNIIRNQVAAAAAAKAKADNEPGKKRERRDPDKKVDSTPSVPDDGNEPDED